MGLARSARGGGRFIPWVFRGTVAMEKPPWKTVLEGNSENELGAHPFRGHGGAKSRGERELERQIERRESRGWVRVKISE